jgi:hypothetical protein
MALVRHKSKSFLEQSPSKGICAGNHRATPRRFCVGLAITRFIGAGKQFMEQHALAVPARFAGDPPQLAFGQ